MTVTHPTLHWPSSPVTALPETLAGLFILALARLAPGDVPQWGRAVAFAWLLGQPFWTPRVIGQLRQARG